MSLNNLSWQSVVLLLGLIAAALFAPMLVGEDAGKVINAVLMALAFLRDPNKPATPPAAGPLVALLLASSLTLSACSGALPRAPARAALVTVAYSIRAAAAACAEGMDHLEAAGKVAEAEELGDRCVKGLRAAQNAVLRGADAVEAWSQAGSLEDYACAVKASVEALAPLPTMLQAAGVEVPGELVDALEVAKEIAANAKGCPNG